MMTKEEAFEYVSNIVLGSKIQVDLGNAEKAGQQAREALSILEKLVNTKEKRE